MKKSLNLRSFLPRTLATASLFALAAWSQSASAQQVVFSTGFDNYTAGQSLTGQAGWTSNDLYTGASYNPGGTGARDVGQSDNVVSNTGYATSTADLQPYLGGAVNVSGGAVPGHPTVYDYHPFGLNGAATMQFNTDFAVSQPGTGTHDSFGFTFQNGGVGSLFSVNFIPTTGIGNNPVNSTTADDFSISSGATTLAPVASFTLGSRYHLTVNVNITAGTFTVTSQPETATGTLSGNVVTLTPVGGVAFTGTITDVAATWVLASTTNAPATTPGGANSTAYTNAGSNTLLFDNYAVTVPEPSTYALLGLGVAGLALGWRRRQAA